MTTCLILFWLLFCCQIVLTHWAMDSAQPLRLCRGIWQQDVNSRSFNVGYKLGPGLICPAHNTDAQSGKFRYQAKASDSFLGSSNHSWTIFATIFAVWPCVLLLKGVTTIRKYCCFFYCCNSCLIYEVILLISMLNSFTIAESQL